MTHIKLYDVIGASVLASSGVLVAAQVTSSSPHRESAQTEIIRMLDKKLVRLRDMSRSAVQAIGVLRHKYGVPVSFISVPAEKPQTIEFREEEVTLRVALDEFVKTRHAYTHALVGNRLVVYPRSGPFEKIIRGVDIKNALRWEATVAFVKHLKRTNAEFRNLTGPPIKGDSRAPVYADRVSLPREATVLQHLAALLGDNTNVAFSILDGLRPGTRVCVLEQVQSSEEKRAAEAKDRAGARSFP